MTATDLPEEVPPGADADEEYQTARIRLMKALLRAGGFDVQGNGGAIRVTIDDRQPRFPCVVEFYGLSRHPEYVRARLKISEPAGARSDQEIEED